MRILRIRIPNNAKYASHPVILLPLNSPPSHEPHPLAHSTLSFPFVSSSCHSKPFPIYMHVSHPIAPPFQSSFPFLSPYPPLIRHRVSFLLFIPSSYSTSGFPVYTFSLVFPLTSLPLLYCTSNTHGRFSSFYTVLPVEVLCA
jgi:hypothetical protein